MFGFSVISAHALIRHFFPLSLVLLVLEAGIDIDVSSLKLIGTRGFLIAFIGSVLPIGIGIIIAIAIKGGTDDIKSSIAAGAVFGPTSLGIGTYHVERRELTVNG